jgi:hypothetical protein
MSEQSEHQYPNKNKEYIDILEIFHIAFFEKKESSAICLRGGTEKLMAISSFDEFGHHTVCSHCNTPLTKGIVSDDYPSELLERDHFSR